MGVAIDVQGDRNAGMAKAFLNEFRVLGLEPAGGWHTVPQPMQFIPDSFKKSDIT